VWGGTPRKLSKSIETERELPNRRSLREKVALETYDLIGLAFMTDSALVSQREFEREV